MRKLLDVIEKLIEYIEFILIFIVTGAIGIQLFSRTLMNRPLGFPEEVSMFVVIVIVFFGISVIERENSHIKVEFLFEMMPRMGKKMITIGAKLLTFILVLWILNGEKELLPSVIPLKTTAAGIPYIWLHTIIVVACTLWLLVIAYGCFLIFKNKES